MLDSRPRGRGFESHRYHCVVSLSKNINPSLVLVQPRKTRPFITERLLMGGKESNQTNKTKLYFLSFGVTAKPGIDKDLIKADAIGRKAVANFIDSLLVVNLSFTTP